MKFSKIIVVVVLLLLVGCTDNSCPSDNEAICTLLDIEDFEIEEDASISIGVFNKNYGEKLVAILNEKYGDIYSYELIEEDSDTDHLDIVQVLVSDVPLLFEDLRPLDETFNTLLEHESLYKFSKEVNQTENFFIPLEVKGILFAYNKTFLEALNVNMNDSNGDNLPDAIDSFEKIGALAESWKKNESTYLDDPIEKVFSFPFNDQQTMISFIENSNYKLIQGVSGEDLSIKEDLLNALTVFQGLNKYPWVFDEKQLSSMGWDYEESLITQSAPFMLVGNWMFYEQYQTSKAYDLVFSKLPTINESEIQSVSSVSGFVLKNKSEYPNAQMQFIKEVKSPEMTKALIDSNLIPVIDPLILDEIEEEIDQNMLQQIMAYTYSHTPELHAFEKNPSIKAYNIYLELDFRGIWKSLFLNEISPEEAQGQMVEKINAWLLEHDLELENEDDELESDHK